MPMKMEIQYSKYTTFQGKKEEQKMNDTDLNPIDIQYEITSNEDQQRLILILRKVKETMGMISAKLDPRIKEAYTSHKGLTALKKETLKPWEDVEDKINLSLKGWQMQKEEEARQLQERINKQLAEDAEMIRQNQLAMAENTENEWDKEVLEEKAKAIVPVTVDLKDCQKTVHPETTGQYKRSNWKCKILDETQIPREFLCPDIKKLDDYAKKYKGTVSIRGCQMWDDFTVVTKT